MQTLWLVILLSNFYAILILPAQQDPGARTRSSIYFSSYMPALLCNFVRFTIIIGMTATASYALRASAGVQATTCRFGQHCSGQAVGMHDFGTDEYDIYISVPTTLNCTIVSIKLTFENLRNYFRNLLHKTNNSHLTPTHYNVHEFSRQPG